MVRRERICYLLPTVYPLSTESRAARSCSELPGVVRSSRTCSELLSTVRNYPELQSYSELLGTLQSFTELSVAIRSCPQLVVVSQNIQDLRRCQMDDCMSLASTSHFDRYAVGFEPPPHPKFESWQSQTNEELIRRYTFLEAVRRCSNFFRAYSNLFRSTQLAWRC